MADIFNSGDLKVKYVSQPGLSGQGDAGIITFNRQGSKGDTSKAMLMSSATISFARNVARQYFLNTDGVAYIVGVGQGSLSVAGLLGKAEDFASVFGLDKDDFCKQLFTVKLDVTGMMECPESGGSGSPSGGIIELGGVIPIGVNITAQIQQDGAVFYNAGASFIFTKMSMGDAPTSKLARGILSGVSAATNTVISEIASQNN